MIVSKKKEGKEVRLPNTNLERENGDKHFPALPFLIIFWLLVMLFHWFHYLLINTSFLPSLKRYYPLQGESRSYCCLHCHSTPSHTRGTDGGAKAEERETYTKNEDWFCNAGIHHNACMAYYERNRSFLYGYLAMKWKELTSKRKYDLTHDGIAR